MFRKMNYKVLAILLVLLLGVYIITRLIEARKGERSFREELVSLNPDEVTSVIYYPQPGDPSEIKLVKGPDGWKVSQGNSKYNADPGVVERTIDMLVELKPERIAATEKSGWKSYQVDDSTGIRVKLLHDSRVIADLVVGKFSYTPQQNASPYQQQQGKMTSYVRLWDEDEVYAVDGFLKMSFQNDVKSFRDRSLVRFNREDIVRIDYSSPGGESFSLSKQGDDYLAGGLLADSATTVKYLSTLARLSSSDFVDDASIDYNNPDYSMKIQAQNSTPVQIFAFEADSVNKYIITSSINEGTFWSGSKTGLFDKLFVSKDHFFKKD